MSGVHLRLAIVVLALLAKLQDFHAQMPPPTSKPIPRTVKMTFVHFLDNGVPRRSMDMANVI